MDGVLSDEVTANWCLAAGEQVLDLRGGEVVVFEDCYHRGFGLPMHSFVRKLLRYYSIVHIHLHPIVFYNCPPSSISMRHAWA